MLSLDTSSLQNGHEFFIVVGTICTASYDTYELS